MFRRLLTNGHFNTQSLGQQALGYIRDDAPFWWLIAVMCGVYAIMDIHASMLLGWHAFNFKWVLPLLFSPVIIVVKWLNDQFKSQLYIVEALVKFIIAFDIAYYMTTTLLMTQHPFVDHQLYQVDRWMHINVVNFVHFSAQHPWFQTAMIYCYKWLDKTFLLLIFVLAILGEKKEMNRLIFIMLVGVAAAGIIFYFLPAIGPCHLFHGPNFPQYDHLVMSEYHKVLNGINPFAKHFFAGFVSIPSIHCYAASLGIYTILRNEKTRILLLPLAVVDLGIIASTMFLGEHYFIDLIGAWVLLGVTALAYNALERHFASKSIAISPKEKGRFAAASLS